MSKTKKENELTADEFETTRQAYLYSLSKIVDQAVTLLANFHTRFDIRLDLCTKNQHVALKADLDEFIGKMKTVADPLGTEGTSPGKESKDAKKDNEQTCVGRVWRWMGDKPQKGDSHVEDEEEGRKEGQRADLG